MPWCFSHSIAQVDMNFNDVYSSMPYFQISCPIQLRLHSANPGHISGTIKPFTVSVFHRSDNFIAEL